MALGFVICLPHLVTFYVHRNRGVIEADLKRWLHIHNKHYSLPVGLIYLLTHYREYRNLFYYRVGSIKVLLNFLCPRMTHLGIEVGQIGEGLYIQHGDSTRIAAKSIGKNCWINQQVTIGFEQAGSPVIGDNVRISAGAKVIGNVVVGNNVIVGANAVVVKSVPDNCTVVGVYPAYIVRRDGQKVKEIL